MTILGDQTNDLCINQIVSLGLGEKKNLWYFFLSFMFIGFKWLSSNWNCVSFANMLVAMFSSVKPAGSSAEFAF